MLSDRIPESGNEVVQYSWGFSLDSLAGSVGTMVFLALYDTEDFGLFPQTRIRIGFSEPILKTLDIVPVDMREIPAWKREQVAREYIDKTDFLALGVGTFTFMRPWAHFAMVYAFTKNRPMFAASNVRVPDGWSREITAGPNPFSRAKWVIRGEEIQLYTLDRVFEVIWTFRTSIPRNSVRYRLEGQSGLFEEIAPMHDWVPGQVNQYLLQWIAESLWLAGL